MKNTNTAEHRIDDIFELHRFIISIFIKDFEEVFTLPEGLNFTHVRAVLILRFHGVMAMSELSGRLALEKGSFTPVATALITRGYVRKEQSAEDRRVYNLALTGEGTSLADRFKKEHGTFISGVLDRLEPEERKEYFDLVFRLNEYNRKIKGQ